MEWGANGPGPGELRETLSAGRTRGLSRRPVPAASPAAAHLGSAPPLFCPPGPAPSPRAEQLAPAPAAPPGPPYAAAAVAQRPVPAAGAETAQGPAVNKRGGTTGPEGRRAEEAESGGPAGRREGRFGVGAGLVEL